MNFEDLLSRALGACDLAYHSLMALGNIDNSFNLFSQGLGDMQKWDKFKREVVGLIEKGPPPISVEWIQTSEKNFSGDATHKRGERDGSEPKGKDGKGSLKARQQQNGAYQTGMVTQIARFRSPLSHWLPEESAFAFFQYVHQQGGSSGLATGSGTKGMVVHCPGTGDEWFWMRRKLLAEPLLSKKGISSLIMMAPFYGKRRPSSQRLHYVPNLVDFKIQMVAGFVEAASVLRWLRGELDSLMLHKIPVGLTGMSLGAGTAICAGLMSPGDFALVPCMGSWNASPYVIGIVKNNIAWNVLRKDHLDPSLAFDELKECLEAVAIGEVAEHMPKEKIGRRVVIQVGVENDHFVPKEFTRAIEDFVAPYVGRGGSFEQRWLIGGHLTGYFFHSGGEICEAIGEAFDKMRERPRLDALTSALRCVTAAFHLDALLPHVHGQGRSSPSPRSKGGKSRASSGSLEEQEKEGNRNEGVVASQSTIETERLVSGEEMPPRVWQIQREGSAKSSKGSPNASNSLCAVALGSPLLWRHPSLSRHASPQDELGVSPSPVRCANELDALAEDFLKEVRGGKGVSGNETEAGGLGAPLAPAREVSHQMSLSFPDEPQGKSAA
uniref:Uncharacterized protein n=1 Tax=Chromera velia CCMP2878 TaxID=1169474 RepID=A0A0G4HQP9_9ALVE|eukprot:Cvel_7981.t1-p1 / transcript=Cvel_7981.t1 / gene=Cvel_7981 / organism=Chromera_velia_CCMP2878 / gene_product=Uncharacterized protein C4orf29 homolog, putative / transcript_product=Uncharacterized protein C4orf29 homolog, putative / location=Cvel_scaffold429:72317-77665(-) / protein_length=608 / sequence_SO=supercontig / SO=protein_coding / is_pseudo=false